MSATARRLTLLTAVSLIAATAGASEIYKWTDTDGNVHYGDRPEQLASAERLSIESRRTDPDRVAGRIDARREALDAAREERAAAEADQPSPEDERKAEAERAEQCETHKERLQQYVQSRRLYREDENGERVYLDEEEMLAARNEVQEKVTEYCGG